MSSCSEELKQEIKYMVLKILELNPQLKTLQLIETGFSDQDSDEIAGTLLSSNINSLKELSLKQNGDMFKTDSTVDKWIEFVGRQQSPNKLFINDNGLR